MVDYKKISKLRKKATLGWLVSMGSFVGQGLGTKYGQISIGAEQYVNKLPSYSGDIIYGLGFGIVALSHFLNLINPIDNDNNNPTFDKGVIDNGAYSILRHPIYLGFRLSSLGFVVIEPNLETILGSAAVFLSTEITARLEEKKMLALYEDEYKDYQSRVSRWIPFGNSIKKGLKNFEDYISNVLKKSHSLE